MGTISRRAAALAVDLVVPCLPTAAVAGAAWLLVRPDLAEDMAALGAALLVALVAIIAWLAAFMANEILVAAAKHGTVGDRLFGFRLDVTGAAGRHRWKLAGRATLRLGVALLVLTIFGVSTEQSGRTWPV